MGEVDVQNLGEELGAAASGLAGLDGQKYLAFAVGGHMLALPLSEVHSVLRPVPVTPVPFMPAGVLGAINLRSEIVPLLDLRVLLGGAPRPMCRGARFLVLEDDGRLRGVVVDRLHEVLRVRDEDRVPDLEVGKVEGAELVSALIRHEGEIYSVLDPARVSVCLEEASLSAPDRPCRRGPRGP